ncbi:serine protease snake-like [Sergentomyia squamirostris]
MFLTFLLFVLLTTFSQIIGQDVIFRDENPIVGSRCESLEGPGTCVFNVFCKNPNGRPYNEELTICYFHEHRTPVICCPVTDVITLEVNQTANRGPSSPGIQTQALTAASSVAPPRICDRMCQKYNSNFTNEILTSMDNDIVLGTNAYLGEFPHMAIVGVPKLNGNGIQWICGGSLISDKYILSAAHCFAQIKPTIIRLGERDLFTDDDNEGVRDFGIENVSTHPEYRSISIYNDIALVKLNETVQFTKYIRPACLNSVEEGINKYMMATGWGHTSFGGIVEVPIMQKVQLGYLANDQCLLEYKPGRRMINGLQDTQMCAGATTDDSDACQGDSGGPLAYFLFNETISTRMYHIVGITSFGKGCGPKIPLIYTRVSSFLDWIESTVWN